MTQDPKLIIDEDWKSQVEREKQQSRKTSEEMNSQPPDMSQLPPPPPANFEMLVTGLATQAVAAMGQFSPADIRLDYAKHYIDLLELLQQKTVRNLTGQEHDMLKSVLHQLRLLYVSATSADDTSGSEGTAPQSKLELP